MQIASYRDTEIINTIKSALSEATFPKRIVIGVCLQDNKETYRKVRKAFPKCLIHFVPYQKTKGLGWARRKAQDLATDEKYTLQIDSHMRFSKDWDNLAIQMIGECPSKKVVISHICPDWKEPWSIHIPRTLAAWAYDEDIIMVQEGVPSAKTVPMQHAFICAHFVFAKTKFFNEIPIDPKLGYWYEEASTILRAWTSGWDLYAPNRIVVRHTWEHKHLQRSEQPTKHLFSHKLSRSRWRRLCGLDKKPITDEYGIGNVRTIKQYEEFAGVNFEIQTFKKKALKGKVKLF